MDISSKASEAAPPSVFSLKQVRALRQQKLMDALKFSEEDLKANRKGEITENQRGRLLKLQRLTALWIIFSAGLLLTLILLPLLAEYSVDFAKIYSTLQELPGWAEVIGIVLFGVCIAGVRVYFQRDISRNHVLYVTGALYKKYRVRGNYGPQMYLLDFKIERFSFSNRLIFDAFTEGEIYTIYFAANTNTMLSAEEIFNE